MNHHARPLLLRKRCRRLIEGRIEKAARRRRREPEWMLLVRLFDRGPVIGQSRHFGDWPAVVRAAERHIWPVRLETKLAVRPGKTVQIMRLPERRLAIEPPIGLKLGERAAFGNTQHLIDELTRVHCETAMLDAQSPGEGADHLVIITALARWLDQLGAQNQILMPTPAINVVVLEKSRRRQNHIGHLRGFSHKLLVYADKQVITCKAAFHLRLIRAHRNRIGVLDDERANRWSATQCVAISCQDRSNT